MSQSSLRNNDGNPFLYLETASGSTAVGTDASGADDIVKIVTGLTADIDPTSAAGAISIETTTPGNIEFRPKGTGQSTFINGDVEIQGTGATPGNLLMQNTTAAGLAGVIEYGGDRFIHNFGTNNTFVGELSGNFSLTASQNVGVGHLALNSLTDGISNVAIGDGALQAATSNDGAIAIGTNALNALNAGTDGNLAIGFHSLQASVSDHFNTAVGFNSLAALNGGSNNTAFGGSALQTSTADSDNTALGYATLTDCNGGSDNTAVGSGAMFNLTTGSNNTGVGKACISLLTSGSNNTVVGNDALFSGLTTSNSIIIGNAAASGYVAAESSNIVIGNAGTVGDNNKIIIGTQGAGAGQQNTCFIAGINGVAVTATGTVVVSSTGQLGTISGSTPTVWNDVTGASATMAVNNGYVADNAGLVTLTLPVTAAFGNRFEIVGKGAGGWTIAQTAGQQIHFAGLDSTSGVGGSISSTLRYDCVELICVTANTSFVVKSSVGNITVV